MESGHRKPMACVLAIAAALATQACAARATATPSPTPPPASNASGGSAGPGPSADPALRADLAPLSGSNWALVESDGKRLPAGTERPPTLGVEGSRASGFSGCNRWGGEILPAVSGAWKLGPVASTRMACDEPEMQLENRFLDALSGAIRWKLDGARLVLLGADGKARLVFTPQREG